MLSKLSLYIIIILTNYSCGNWSLLDFKKEIKDDLTESRGEKLIENFKFEDDMQEKFATKDTLEAKETEEKEAIKKQEVKKLPEQKKKTTTNKKNKITNQDKSNIAPTITKQIKRNGILYPSDFPEDLIKLDTENKKFHHQIKMIAPINEKIFLDVTYLGITVGKIILSAQKDNEINGRKVHHLFAKLVSAPFYKYIYKLDDIVESFVDKETLLPVKYSLVQRESGQSIDDLQLFDRELLMTYFREKRTKDDKTKFKKKDVFIPYYAQDGLSSLFYLRGIPGEIGKTYNFPLVTKGRVTIMTVHVEKRERIETKIGPKDAILFKMKTRYTGDVVKKGDLSFWLTDDEHRVILKFEGSTNMGRVTGEIVAYEND